MWPCSEAFNGFIGFRFGFVNCLFASSATFCLVHILLRSSNYYLSKCYSSMFFTVLFGSRHSFFLLYVFFFLSFIAGSKSDLRKTDYRCTNLMIFNAAIQSYQHIKCRHFVVARPQEKQCDFFFFFQLSISNWMQLNAFARSIKHFIRFKLKTKSHFTFEVICAIAAVVCHWIRIVCGSQLTCSFRFAIVYWQ